MTRHKPVMLEQVINTLLYDKHGIYCDVTFGDGGHSKAILSKLTDNGHLYVSDKDHKAIDRARTIFDGNTQVSINKLSFTKLYNFSKKNKLIGKINGIFADLGLSTTQLLDNTRGFSFYSEDEIDMRIDKDNRLTAKKVLINSNTDTLATIFNLVQEKKSKAIAQAIKRNIKKIKTPKDLAELVCRVKKSSRRKIHPATKIFLALRIFVNKELEEVRRLITDALDILKEDGRLVIITFHSLEDRIVKHMMKQAEVDKKGVIISRIFPSEEEIQKNNSARSAILRCIKKI